MASSGTAAPGTDAATPVLVSIKAVDPSQYPYYGEVKLDPPMTLQQALAPDTVVARRRSADRLNLKVGETIRVGRPPFSDRRGGPQRARPACREA